MDGQVLIKTLRASPVFKGIPIIILSSRIDSETRIACLEMGADDYIIKPFNPLEVKLKIITVLRRLEHKYIGYHSQSSNRSSTNYENSTRR